MLKMQKSSWMLRPNIYPLVLLVKSEYDKIIKYELAKEIWDRLQVLHEGTNQVKETETNMFVHQYEMLKMNENE